MNTKLASLWRKDKYVSAVLLYLMLHSDEEIDVSIREIAGVINEDRNKVSRALVWLESNGFIGSIKDGHNYKYTVRCLVHKGAEKTEDHDTEKKTIKDSEMDSFMKPIKVSNGDSKKLVSEVVSDSVSHVVSGETVDDMPKTLANTGDSDSDVVSDVVSDSVSEVVSKNKNKVVSLSVSEVVSLSVSGETSDPVSNLLGNDRDMESETVSDVVSDVVSEVVSLKENEEVVSDIVSLSVSEVVSGETVDDISKALIDIDNSDSDVVSEVVSEVVSLSVSHSDGGFYVATQETEKETEKEKEKVTQKEKEKEKERDKEANINLNSADSDMSVIFDDEKDELSDIKKKAIAMVTATEIYDYYVDKLKAGKRQDSIDKIHKLLLGTHYADKKKVYTPEEIYAIIDNYARVATGGRDTMYSPDRMFGRDAHFKLFTTGSIGMEHQQREIESQMKAMDDAAKIYHFYITKVRKDGGTGFAKTEAINRIKNILMGKAELSRPYTVEEIHKAIESYRYDKRSSEEKYRAVPQNFFGGHKFYIRDYLEKEVPVAQKPQQDIETEEDVFVNLKF